MVHTTISVSEDVKKELERLKRKMEVELGRTLSWDDFFSELIKERTEKEKKDKKLILSDEEAEILLRLTEEGRRSWRRNA
ncbi:VapB-type antitoxin [Sulfolobus tengchongensis]|uniref:VapB-type antitoxin n=1 Tax=Sulfolobus tengchongensis TaxID=207809 RepID=A0AAX4KX54_9CREN